MYKKFKMLEMPDTATSKLQENVSMAIGDLPTTEIIQGRIVKDISLKAGVGFNIEHGLNREIVGWIIIRKTNNADIYEQTSAAPTLVLKLISNIDSTINLWIF